MKQLSIVIAVFIFFLVIAAPVHAVVNIIDQGGDVFIGEQGLDISAAVGNSTQIAWFAPGKDPSADIPDSILNVGDSGNFYIAPVNFVGKPGTWYRWDGVNQGPAFIVVDPSIEITVWDQTSQKDVTGKSVPNGSIENFRIESNLYSITNRAGYNASTDGQVTIRVGNSDGLAYTELFRDTTVPIPLTALSLDSPLYYWVSTAPLAGASTPYAGWNTGVHDAQGARMYKYGVYTAWAECNVNGMKDNYKAPNGADYTGKTISAVRTITIALDPVRIEASKDAVVRGNPISVTITGRPGTSYYLWVRGTGQMTGTPTDMPPVLVPTQSGVATDPVGGPYTIGSYQYGGLSGPTIRDDVPSAPPDGVCYYAQITTSASGTRTVGWLTSQDTRVMQYTFRVEREEDGQYSGDEVDVRVEKGTVTVVAAGDQVYFRGEDVEISGTNSEATDTTYLFITGPDLPAAGGTLTDPHTAVVDGIGSSFTRAVVEEDNTWEYMWKTANLSIDAGTYTIYAVSTPNNLNNLNNLSSTESAYVTVIIRNPATSFFVPIGDGWNLFSTPVSLDPDYSGLDRIFNESEQGKVAIVLGWNGYWFIPDASYDLVPLQALFIKADGQTLACLVPSSDLTTPPVRSLPAGVSLISAAAPYEDGSFTVLPVSQALVSINETGGGKTGYSMVISPALNQPGWGYARGGPPVDVLPFKGYWIIMENADTLYGFSTTPLGL